MKWLLPERISALPTRLRKRLHFNATRVNWEAVSCQLLSLLLTYALLLQLVPRVAIARPEPPQASRVANGALTNQKASTTLGSLFSKATGTIGATSAPDPANSLLSPPPNPPLGNGIAVVRHATLLNGNGRVESIKSIDKVSQLAVQVSRVLPDR